MTLSATAAFPGHSQLRIHNAEIFPEIWNENRTSEILDRSFVAAETQRHQTTEEYYIFWFGIAIWSYLLFVVLSPKPRCYCKTSMKGKVAVITGGSDGVGKVTAFELARKGAKIILPCRNLKKGEKVADEIRMETGNKNIHVVYVDFTNLDSVKCCAHDIRKSVSKIDILINNAGIGHGVGSTCDGFPQIFGVNHLGPFLFTTQLLSLLRKSGSSRIICVSSIAHLWGDINFNSIHEVDTGSVHSQFRAYSQSKLANVLFIKQLDRNERRNGITTYAAHPGWTFTGLFREFPFLMKLIAFPIFHLFLYLPKEGAQTQIHLALAPGIESESGNYFVSCRPSRTCTNALNHKLAADLWSYSEKAVAPTLNRDIHTCTSI